MGKRADSDEFYVLDLCDEILGTACSRQHKFEWLRGDYSEKRRSHSFLPVDGFWEALGLVVEYAERQHTEAVTFFDRHDTVSGVSRGEQRRIYDQRRAQLIPANGIVLVTIPATAFNLRRKRITRHPDSDLVIVRALLNHAKRAEALGAN